MYVAYFAPYSFEMHQVHLAMFLCCTQSPDTGATASCAPPMTSCMLLRPCASNPVPQCMLWQDLVARCQLDDRVKLELLGETLDGHDIDMLQIGVNCDIPSNHCCSCCFSKRRRCSCWCKTLDNHATDMLQVGRICCPEPWWSAVAEASCEAHVMAGNGHLLGGNWAGYSVQRGSPSIDVSRCTTSHLHG